MEKSGPYINGRRVAYIHKTEVKYTRNFLQSETAFTEKADWEYTETIEYKDTRGAWRMAHESIVTANKSVLLIGVVIVKWMA